MDEINLLPDKLRGYIHDLETRADKAGQIREIAYLTEQRDALALKVEEMKQEIESLRKSRLETENQYGQWGLQPAGITGTYQPHSQLP